ncbi:MAG: LuxR C-terminal-related transcriptional regulator [Rickettsiella sp.]|nr:LuxR C-terminal-related transcriptional regulator [Rickettsiella sp.]
MANKSITPSKLRRKLIDIEEQYYEITAECLLRSADIQNPTKQQIINLKKYLANTYFGFSLIFGKELTDRECNILFRATSGEKVTDTSSTLNISLTRVAQLRLSVLKKLQAENIEQAIYRATRLGYLPPKANAFKEQETEEVKNASS